jgi:transposase-like protein
MERSTMSDKLDKQESVTTVKQHRYPWVVIETAVNWYHQEALTYRSVSEKLAQHGVGVSHKTVFEWVQKFSDSVKKPKKSSTKAKWDVEETQVKVNGEWKYMYQAVDKQGNVLNLVFRERRNPTSAKNFLTKALVEKA